MGLATYCLSHYVGLVKMDLILFANENVKEMRGWKIQYMHQYNEVPLNGQGG